MEVDYSGAKNPSVHEMAPLLSVLSSQPIGTLASNTVSIYRSIDSRISPLVFSSFKRVVGSDLTSTPVTNGLPLIASPTPLVLTTGVYLLVILGGVLRIKALQLKRRDREPWLLQAIVLVHNLFLFGLSVYMCCGIVYEAIQNGYMLWGNPYRPHEVNMAHYIYIFYVSKYIELGDTLIMVAKRSVRQISVLHVYHHCSIAAIWWAITYHTPGGDAYFSAALNSGVHVAMYGYYFLAALLGKNEKLKRKYLFWGRYVTQIQMSQFVLNMLQAYWLMHSKAAYTPWLSKVLFYYMLSLLALFANFYVQKYMVGGKRAPRAKKEA